MCSCCRPAYLYTVLQNDVLAAWQHLSHQIVVVKNLSMPNDVLILHLCSVWELYIFFSVHRDTNKLKLLSVDSSLAITIERLKTFKSKNAHCWSEDDETSIRAVIGEDVAR